MRAGMVAVLLACGMWAAEPSLVDYPAGPRFTGTPATPVLNRPELRLYRTRIQDGVATGRGVWTGKWNGQPEVPGPNFAGHYSVIRWGCGSDCVMMVVVNLKTGAVFGPPIIPAPGQLAVPMDVLSERLIDFRVDSTLIVFRNVCAKAREECGVYAFQWKDERFTLVQRALVDLTKQP